MNKLNIQQTNNPQFVQSDPRLRLCDVCVMTGAGRVHSAATLHIRHEGGAGIGVAIIYTFGANI